MFCPNCNQATAACRCFLAGKRIAASPWIWICERNNGTVAQMRPLKILEVHRDRAAQRRNGKMMLTIESADYYLYFKAYAMDTGYFGIKRNTSNWKGVGHNCETSVQSAEETLQTARYSEPDYVNAIIGILSTFFAESGISRLSLSYLQFPLI
jgi:hypothetical protein